MNQENNQAEEKTNEKLAAYLLLAAIVIVICLLIFVKIGDFSVTKKPGKLPESVTPEKPGKLPEPVTPEKPGKLPEPVTPEKPGKFPEPVTPPMQHLCPDGMEKIDGSGKTNSFCLDIHEVSNKKYLYNSKMDKNPVVKVSWEFADRHCKSKEKHLPTAEEWMAAFSRKGGILNLLNHEWVDGDDGHNRKLYGDLDKGIDYENYALHSDDVTNSDISFRCAKPLKNKNDKLEE
ncbi:MAG: hypothetical protein GY795_20030 [Desulfobacterales bacterium]|nr:hypothetical protein [Desulfobacterales bacterium]